MRVATQTPSRAASAQPSSQAARDIVDGGWVEAVKTLRDELRRENFTDDPVDEDGYPIRDICQSFFSEEERGRLVRAVETMQRTFPFPSFSANDTTAYTESDPSPNCRELRDVFESAIRKMKEASSGNDMASEDAIDVMSRTLALRSGLLRLAAELNAFLLQEHVQDAGKTGKRAPRSSHRDHLVAALGEK